MSYNMPTREAREIMPSATDAQTKYAMALIRNIRSAQASVTHLTISQLNSLSAVESNCWLSKQAASELISVLRAVPGNSKLSSEKPGTAAPVSPWAGIAEDLAKLPLSRYALPRTDGSNAWDFFEITESKTTKRRFLNRLIGAPGSWRRINMPPEVQKHAIRHIMEDAKSSAIAYASQHGRCAVCDSPLSDPASIARSMGPVCAKRF